MAPPNRSGFEGPNNEVLEYHPVNSREGADGGQVAAN